eukprot:Rmarinus@m.26380
MKLACFLVFCVFFTFVGGDDVLLGGIFDEDGEDGQPSYAPFISDIVSSDLRLNNVSILMNYSSCTTMDSVSLNQKLEHNVIGFVGSPCVDSCTNTAAHATYFSTPVLSTCLVDNLSSKANFPFFLRAQPPFSARAAAVVSLAQMYTWRRVGLLVQSTEPFLDAMQHVSTILEADGVTVFKSVFVDEDISDALTELQSNTVSIVVYAVEPALVGIVVDEADSLGMMQVGYAWIALDADLYTDWWRTSDSEAEVRRLAAGGYMLSVAFSLTLGSDSPERASFEDQYGEAAGVPPPTIAYLAYDAFSAFNEAILSMQEAGADPRDGKILKEYLSNVSFDGVSGPFSFDSSYDRNGDVAICNFVPGHPAHPESWYWRESIVFPSGQDAILLMNITFTGNTSSIPWDVPYIDSYYLGALLPLSLNVGRNALEGISLALEEIQKHLRREVDAVYTVSPRAPLRRIRNRFSLELSVMDTHCSSLEAIQIASEFFNDHNVRSSASPVVSLIGAGCEDVCVDIGRDHSWTIPQISYSCQSMTLGDKVDYPFFVRGATSSLLVPAVWMLLIEEFGWTQVSVVSTAVEPYAGEMTLFTDLLKGAGVSVLYSGTYVPDADPSEHIQKIKEAGSAIVFYAMSPPDMQNLFAAAEVFGMAREGLAWIGHGLFNGATWYANENPVTQELIERGASCAIGVGVGTYDSNFDVFRARYEENYAGSDPDAVLGAIAYDAVYAIAIALDAVISASADDSLHIGDVDGSELTTYLHDTKFWGAAWEFDLNVYGDRHLPLVVQNWLDGTWHRKGNVTIPADAVMMIYLEQLEGTTSSSQSVQDAIASMSLEFDSNDPLMFHGCVSTPPSDRLPPAYIQIAGLVPVHWLTPPKTHSTAPQHLAVLWMAVNEINNKTDGIRDDLLPMTQLRFAWGDTYAIEAMSVHTAEHIDDIFHSGKSTDVVIASYFSEDTIAIQNVLKTQSIPQVGYGASWAELSDPEAYPFFFRTVPGDGFMGAALADLMGREPFSFKRCSVVYSNNMLGHTARDYFLEYAAELGIVIAGDFAVEPMSNSSMSEALASIRTIKTSVNALLVDFDTGVIWINTAVEENMLGGDSHYVWFAVDEVLSIEALTNIGGAAGSFFCSFCRTPSASSCSEEASGELCYEKFLDRYADLPPSCTKNGTFSVESDCVCSNERDHAGNFLYRVTNDMYMEVTGESAAPGFQCARFNPADMIDTFTPYAYDAVYFVAEALHYLIYDQGENDVIGAELKEALLEVALNGTTSLLELQRTPMGDRESEACYDIFQTVVQIVDDQFEFVSYVGKWTESSHFTRCEENLNPTSDRGAVCLDDVYFATENNTRPSEYCWWDNFYLDPTSKCQPCPEGLYNYLPQLNECTSCGYQVCLQDDCSAGQYFNGTSCVNCPAGSYSPLPGGTVCHLCPEGEYAHREGMAQCLPCDIAEYASSSGSHVCSLCPSHSQRLVNSTGTSLNECLCDSGYYYEVVLDTWQCTSCPTGGECVGGMAAPVNEKGYWGDQKYPTKFWECPIQSACEAKYKCATGRYGRMCGTCAADFNSFGSECMQCASSNSERVMSTILGMGGVVLTWFLINKIAASSFDSIDLLLLYLQLAALVSAFPLRWPESMSLVLSGIGVINFDVDYFSPSCVMEWDYAKGIYVQLFLPVLYSVAVFFIFLLRHYLTHRSLTRNIDLSPLIQEILSFLDVTYHTMCSKSMEVFLCRRLLDGSSMLVFGPTVTCDTEEHYWLQAVGAIGVFVYAFGVPAVYGLILYRGHRDGLLSNSKFFNKYSFLYSRYESKYLWWHFIIIIRRLLFVVIRTFGYEDPLLQVGAAMTVLIGMASLHVYARPFIDNRLDVQEVTTVVSLLVLLFCGILFYSDDVVDQASIVARFSIVFTVALALALMSIDVLAKLHKRLVYHSLVCTERFGAGFFAYLRGRQYQPLTRSTGLRHLRRPLSHELPLAKPPTHNHSPHSHANGNGHNASCGTGNGHVSPSALSKGGKGEKSVSLWQVGARGTKGAVKAASPGGLPPSVDALLLKHRVRILAWHLDGAELHNTLRPDFLCKWLLSHPSEDDMRLYMYVDQVMLQSLSDHSLTSIYSTSRLAQFYRVFTQDEAAVFVDWLLSASPEEHEACRVTMQSMLQFYLTHDPDASYVSLIVEEDVSSVLAWLVTASHDERASLRLLLDSIARAAATNSLPLRDLLARYSTLSRENARMRRNLFRPTARNNVLSSLVRKRKGSVSESAATGTSEPDIEDGLLESGGRGGSSKRGSRDSESSNVAGGGERVSKGVWRIPRTGSVEKSKSEESEPQKKRGERERFWASDREFAPHTVIL